MLKWAVTEHFKEYLPYQSFVVGTDNNPLMYIMSTPYLDAMGHWWIVALACFNFKLKYQKGHDNMVADILSQFTTWLNLETAKSILDGVALGMVHHAEVHDPAMVKGDQHLEQEVCITAGLLIGGDACYWLSQSPEKGPNVECSVGTGWRHGRRQIERHFWWNMSPVKKVTWYYIINRISWFSRGLLSTRNAQRQNWRSPALCGPQGTLCCHS